MKTNEINSFLAEKIGVKCFLSPKEDGEKYYQFETPTGKTKFTCVRVEDFDPMHNISDTFMVQAEIAKMGDKVMRKYAMWLEDEDVVNHNDMIDYTSLFVFANATAAQRSEAAVRALGTDDEIKELL